MQRAGAKPIADAPAGSGARPEQFSVPVAASLQERRPRTLKHGGSFAVFDHNGDVLSGPGAPDGLFHRDTRYLSHLYLTVDGQRPLLLSFTVGDDNATFTSGSRIPICSTQGACWFWSTTSCICAARASCGTAHAMSG